MTLGGTSSDDPVVAGFREVAADEFEPHFRAALADPAYGSFLTPYDSAALRQMRCFLAEDGKVGGAIKETDDGHREAVAIFNQGGSPGAGLAMLQALTALGAERLDCIGDVLRLLYERVGFRVVETLPWDDRYSPARWDYDLFGRPNVYVMEFQP